MKTGQEIYYLIMEMSASEQDKYFRTLTALEIDLFLGFVNDPVEFLYEPELNRY